MAGKKDNNYFEMFVRLTDYSCSAAKQFCGLLGGFDPAKMPEEMKKMHAIEHSADMEKHNMMKLLAKEFITPIEREDIFQLAQELDPPQGVHIPLAVAAVAVAHFPAGAEQPFRLIVPDIFLGNPHQRFHFVDLHPESSSFQPHHTPSIGRKVKPLRAFPKNSFRRFFVVFICFFQKLPPLPCPKSLP